MNVPKWLSYLFALLLVAVLCAILGAALSGCVATVNDRTGAIETDLFGVIPWTDELPAPPDHPLDVPPWEEDGWLILSEDGQVEAVRAWNADHGWVPDREPVVPRAGGTAGALIGLVLAGWKAFEAIATPRGRRNAAGVFRPRVPATTRLAAAGALILGRDTPDALRKPAAPAEPPAA